jgi:hypothetical protein
MGIAYTECRDSEVQLLGFSKNNTSNPDAFIVINVNNWVAENSDAVDIIINGNTYTFSNQDPLLHLYREGAQKEKYQSIREKSVKTDKGYLLEVAFSLDKLMLVPKDGIPLNIEIRVKDGDYSIAGELQWAEGGPFMLATGYNSYEYSIPYNPPTEESESDNGLDWSKVKEYLVREKSYPNTKKDFSAKWKVCYDMDNLYFLVDITDDTNLQGRRVNISLNGTGYKTFKAVRTIDKTETYHDIGIFTVENGSIVYDAPSRSVTTFTGIE